MKKLRLEAWVGRCAVADNPDLAAYEVAIGMTSQQRLHAGLPVQFPLEDSSRVGYYERGARELRRAAYRRLSQ